MATEMEPKSKSQVKREMLALQDLGEKLAELTKDQIEKIDMPPELREALIFVGTVKKHGARRRQLQHIGALMRDVDPEPIQKALETLGRGRRQDAERFQELERWRDALVQGDDDLLEEIVSRFPGVDRQNLRQLALNARKEREGNKPPKASRALFRLLETLSKPLARESD